MPLFDIFKKQKEEEKKKAKDEKKEKPKEKITEKLEKKETKTEEKPVRVEKAKPKKGIPENAYRILLSPNVTEKATDLTEQNKYVFKVHKNANKKQIKKVIEDIFGVNVLSVKIINIPPKKRRFKGKTGYTGGYKKAIIQIRKDQKIEVLPR